MNLKESDVEKITAAVNLAKSESKDLDEHIRRFKNITESSLDKYGYQGLNLMSELFKENFSTATHYINVGKYFFHHGGMFRSDCLVEFISIVKPLGDAGQFTHLVNTAVNFIHNAGLNVEGLDEQNQIDLFCSSATNFCERCATVFADLELHPKLALLPFMETLSPKGNNPSALDGSKEIELTIGGVLLTLYPSDFNKHDLMATYESFVAYDKNNESRNKGTVTMNEKYLNDILQSYPALGKEGNPNSVVILLDKIMNSVANDTDTSVLHEVLLLGVKPVKEENFVYRRRSTFLVKSGGKTIIFNSTWLADWCDNCFGLSVQQIKDTIIVYSVFEDYCLRDKNPELRLNTFSRIFSRHITHTYGEDPVVNGADEIMIYPFLEIISVMLTPLNPSEFLIPISTYIGTFNVNLNGLKESLKDDPMPYVRLNKNRKETVTNPKELTIEKLLSDYPEIGKESHPGMVCAILDKIVKETKVNENFLVFKELLLRAAEPVKDDDFTYMCSATFLTKTGGKPFVFVSIWLKDWFNKVEFITSSLLTNTILTYAEFEKYWHENEEGRLEAFSSIFANYIERSYTADLSAVGEREMLIYPFLDIIGPKLYQSCRLEPLISIPTSVGVFNLNIEGVVMDFQIDPMKYVSCEGLVQKQPVDLKAVNEHLEERNKQMDNDVAAITENAAVAVTEPVVKELSELLFFKKLEGGTYQLELLKQFDNKEDAKALLERITALL